MQEDRIDRILAAVKAPLNHPLFFSRIFALMNKSLKREYVSKQNDPLFLLFVEEYEELSRRLDRSKIQESTSVRNILRSRKLATLLINDKGDLNLDVIPKAIEYLQANMYSLGPNRQYDAKRQQHILNVLNTLQNNKEIARLLKKISKPLSNKYAEDLIRETLHLPSNVSLNDAHARRAVLAAWLTYLRQNIGSCFATAPAEVVHDEQAELFLQDMAELLATGRLKRTFSGIEYAVPLSASWGNGDLKKPLVLQHSAKGASPEIWYSPGLITAFEAVGFFSSEYSEKQKVTQLKNWLEPIFQYHSTYHPIFILTAEEIIRKMMLQNLGLTEQNIKDYEERPKSILQSSLMIQSNQYTKNLGGMGERCANFLYQFELAKNAFKRLTDNALLKAWEFTLASFSETKLEFTRWNLYASLGMGTNEAGGIGQCIQQVIQRKLDVVNRQVQDIQYEYEMVYTQVQMLEGRMRQASTEKEIQWLKAEYQSRANEFYSLQELRNETQYRARSLVNLYETLYNMYLELFKDYFQEVYDADMQEVITGPFDDSPAGFRLLYKHGRSNTSQWTRIRNHNEFIDSLSSFFAATEPQIASLLEQKGLEKDLGEVVTAIINHVKTKEFLESAFYRMAVAHNVAPIKDPLHNLEHIEKKPWVYTSGGTMNTLVSCYYRLEDKPKEIAKWVENEMELLVFLADTMKQVSSQYLSPYVKGQRSAMLMQSPTHAFLLKPNLQPFKDTWSTEDFTYTFIRDRIVKVNEQFIENLLLNDEMIRFLIDGLLEKVPDNFKPRFKSVFGFISSPLNPIFFREYLIDSMYQDRGLNYRGRPVLAEEEIDSFLYSNLPLFSVNELKDRLNRILILLPGLNGNQVEDILSLFEKIPLYRSQSLISANQLQDICKALICLAGHQTSTPYNYHLHISQAAQKLGFAMPQPIIFADTNWVKDEFGFVVNPGTGRLELWRLDYTGSFGYPMTGWKQWLDGSQPNQKWGIYIKPPEYGQN